MESSFLLTNPVLQRIEMDEPALGVILHLSRSADIVRLVKSSGHDFVFIDTQHALYNRETIGNIAHAALGVGLAPFARVSSVTDPDIPVLLDNGVTGLIFPDVNTVDDAREAVRRSRFAPVGERSVSGAYVHFGYQRVPAATAVEQLGASTVVICMIETPEALENARAIAAVEGVDGLHIG